MEQKNNKYVYLASYTYREKGIFGGSGFGRVIFRADHPIEHWKDIEDIEKTIKENENFRNVLIFNYILISEDTGEDICQE